MKLANNLSVWAARRPRQAVPLLIILELVNAVIGIMVGSALLGTFSPWVLMGLLLAMVLMNVGLKRYGAIRLFDLAEGARFGLQKQIFFFLFCINLCAYAVAGGIMGRMSAFPEASSSLYGSSTSASTLSEISSDNKKMSFREKILQKTIRQKAEKEGSAGRRVGYIALFLLGIALAVVGAYLACATACSGYGFAAVLVLLLSLGVLAGGFYFLGRGIDKNMKPLKEMTPDERKREKRRYLRTLLGTIGGAVLLILISALNN